MIKGNSFSLTSIYNRNLERAQEDFYQQYNFDAAGLAKLEKELEQAIKERDRV